MTDKSTKDPSPLYRYRFGSAEFDQVRFELRVDGKPIALQRRPLEVLDYLLRHAGEVVSRQELQETVWSNRPTVENVIDTAVSKLRVALGEANAGYLITQPRVGYRLSGTVERVAVGRHFADAVRFASGDPVPLRQNFVLERHLSRNARNEVWLARHAKTDEPRVYKFSSDGEGLAALKREATLARMLRESLGDRPDFVRVLDWNFNEPPFFLECEYGGVSFAEWAEQSLAAYTLEQRIELFLQAANAVAAAHSVGVLHKDIKPANFLIHKGDTTQVRVIDFGSAGLLEPDRLAALGITRQGMTLTQGGIRDPAEATLLYAAPERLAGGAATVQSDVFSLGVLLYQLVAGDLRKPMVSSWVRDIADDLLRRDIADATDGDPARRLTSVAALTARLHALGQRRADSRVAADREEAARTMRVALQRSRARRPWIISLTGTLAIALTAISWLYRQELLEHRLLLHSETQVRRQAERADTVTQFLNENVLSSSDPFVSDRHQSRTIRSALDDAASSVADRFSTDPLTEASIRTALGTVYLRILETEPAVAQWQRVVDLLSGQLNPEDHRLIESRYHLAQALALASRFAESEQMLALADRARQQVSPDSRLELLAHRSWGQYYLNQQQCDRGIDHLEQSVAMLKQLEAPDTASLDLARILLGQCYTGVSRFKDSERLATELMSEVKGRSHPSELTLALAKYIYGESLGYQQQYKKAESALDEAYEVIRDKLGPDNQRTLGVLDARCDLYSESDQLEKAMACMTESYRLTRRRYGDGHWTTWGVLSNLGIEQFALKQYAAAETSLQSAHEGLIKTLGPDKPTTLLSGYYLARTLLARGEAGRAAALAALLTPQGLNGAEPGAPWELRLSLLQGLVSAEEHHISQALALLGPAGHLSKRDDPNDSIVQDAQRMLDRIR